MKKEYVPIPFKRTDERVYLLKHGEVFKSVSMEFTQLDLLQVMKHIRGRNERLYRKFRQVILDVDEIEHERTDFNRRIAQRRYNGKFY